MVKFLCICQSENKSEKRQTNKRKNATTMREHWKRCSTQRVNDKFSLAFWQLVLEFFFLCFAFWLFLGLFGFCSCFDFCFAFAWRLKRNATCRRSKANEQCDTVCGQNAHTLARLGCFLAGSQPRFDDRVLKITRGRGGQRTYQNVKRIKCKFYATFKIAGAMFCNLSTTARISKRVEGAWQAGVWLLRRNCCNDNTATSTITTTRQTQRQCRHFLTLL